MSNQTITDFLGAYAKARQPRPGLFDFLHCMDEKESQRWLTNCSQQEETREILEATPGLSSRAIRHEIMKGGYHNNCRCRVIQEAGNEIMD